MHITTMLILCLRKKNPFKWVLYFPSTLKAEWCENVWMNIYNSQINDIGVFFKVSIYMCIIFLLTRPHPFGLNFTYNLLELWQNLKIIFTQFLSELLKKIFRLWIVAKTFPSILQNNVNGLLRSFIRGPFWTEMIGLYESRNLLINERGHCKLKFSVLKLLLSFYARQRERKI